MNVKKFLICLAIPLAVGGLSTLLSNGMDLYKTLVKPPLSPPGWVFPLVWSALFLMMGYASYRVLTANAPKEEKRRALTFYGVQLALNFLWSPIFFGLGWLLVAFFVLVALWVMILITGNLFSKIDQTAGKLLIPYLLWVAFAGYLNFAFFLLN